MKSLIKQRNNKPFQGINIIFSILLSAIGLNANADVTLETQVKITDNGLHFDGVKVAAETVDNGTDKFDYHFGKNISAHGDAVKTYKNYVFMTWYRGGKDDRHVMLSRYNKVTGIVKTIEFPHQHTGYRGVKTIGESHNTIGLSVSPVNGTIHMVYDMHAYDDNNYFGRFKNDFFRYSYSEVGTAEVSDEDFTLAKFVKDTSTISQGNDDYKHITMTGNIADKGNFARLTYPKFFTNTDGTLLLYMRLGGNNNGAYVFNRYNAAEQKWSTFTPFNKKDQKKHGNAYNWGLYGNMKYVNGKLRVGYQQRSNDNNDKYLYQNGVYYAYSDHPEGVGQWKNHKGEDMTWPLVDSDEIKVFEPGDYITHTQANSVYIVGGFDWTVTEKGDVHMISTVRSTNRNRSDYEQVYLHSYKPAGADEFIITKDFTGASNIYTSGDNIYIIGLSGGYPYVEKAVGGTNNFTNVYKQVGGTKFDHGTVYVNNGKVYYYLMESKSGNSMPLHLQIIDLDINANNNVPEGYTFAAEEGETVVVSGTVDIAFGAEGKYVYLTNQTTNVDCTSVVFSDPIKDTAKKCFVKTVVETPPVIIETPPIVIETPPTVTFASAAITLTEGYETFTIAVDAASTVTDIALTDVKLYIGDVMIRSDAVAPYEWGHASEPSELLGLIMGIHTLKAVATDANGNEAEASVNVTIKAKVDTGDNTGSNTGGTSGANTGGEDTGTNTETPSDSGGSTHPLFIIFISLLVWRRLQK